MNFLCIIGLHNWKYGEYSGNGWFKCNRCQTLKKCKYCISCNLICFGGIGAFGVMCKFCERIQ